MKKINIVIAFYVILVSVGSADAIVETWYGGWFDNNFFTEGNWTDGIPAEFIDARVNSGFTDVMIYDSPTPGLEYKIHCLSIGYFNDNLNVVTMNGGIFNITNNLEIGGLWKVGQGKVIINAGHLMGCAVYLGQQDTGIVTINGGIFEPWGLLQLGGNGGIGEVNINGGIARAADLTMTDASQMIIVKDGSLNVTSAWNDTYAKVAGYIANGWIKAAGGYTLHTSTYVSYIGNSGGNWLGTIVTATRDPIPGDLDGDFKVDFTDFAILAEHWCEGV